MIIFDYACLADDSHRRHFIDPTHRDDCVLWVCNTTKETWLYRDGWSDQKTRKKFQPDYAAYYAAAKDDKPIEATLQIFHSLIFNAGIEFQVWCDIPVTYRGQIEEKLKRTYLDEFITGEISMRPDGDTTPWHELKEKWLKEMTKWPELPGKPSLKDGEIFYRGDKPEMAFERSGSPMIEIWKKYGVPVFEVHI